MKKVITRIKGGLGNQLFCYAVARRLALVNNAELVIDDLTGFTRDYKFRRHYMLDRFNIQARKATANERLEPFERYRRGFLKLYSRRLPFEKRRYVEQGGLDFDQRFLELEVKGTIYLDGYWQSEGYFKDVEETIREDLRIIPPMDEQNQRMAEEIRKSQAVAVHVRWFDPPSATMAKYNASAEYYRNAVSLMEKKIELPHYFIFSDDPKAARAHLALPEARVTYVSHNLREENAYADLWLMTQCRHFIIGNSTFSWWGAWLAGSLQKIIIVPQSRYMRFKRNLYILFPQEWLKL